MKNRVTAHLTRLRLLVFCVSLLFVICASLVGSSVSVNAGMGPLQTKATPQTIAPQTPATPATQTTTPAEKTVEMVQKNIQVLNGMPASQLGVAMNYIASSLGVKCTFCHVNKDGKWDFPSDEKPEKATAREMMKMVRGVNNGTFKGNPAVGCFTCHHGSTSPVRVPQLPIAEPTPFADTAAAAAAPAAPVEKPPTADQILAKYTEALGGAAAIEKLKTRTMKGTWLGTNGITLGYEVYQTAPDKIYTVLNTPKQGVFERGFDGQVGWEKSQRGLRDLQGRELLQLRSGTDLFRDIKLRGQFTRISFSRKDKIDGRDVYLLSAIGIDGKGERLYFDAQTGLLVRRITSTRTLVGLIPEQVDYEDYRDVDGMKVPFTIRYLSVDSFFSSTRNFTEIRLNVPVDETKFNKPPAPPLAP
ncbi:MAG: c-type cytochrome [Pyrinomonadaceae bacterium]